MVTLTKEHQVQSNNPVERTDEFGKALQNALESIGSQFGIYRVMMQTGPLTPACLATQLGIAEENARVWLDVQSTRNRLKRSLSTDLYCVGRAVILPGLQPV